MLEHAVVCGGGPAGSYTDVLEHAVLVEADLRGEWVCGGGPAETEGQCSLWSWRPAQTCGGGGGGSWDTIRLNFSPAGENTCVSCFRGFNVLLQFRLRFSTTHIVRDVI